MSDLSPEAKEVMNNKGTEAPFSGKWLHNKSSGVYTCASCGMELFSSEAKFDSGTGWPSFDEPKNLEKVVLKEDTDHGMVRTEVTCAKCHAHLGHVFTDGPTKTGARYCINSVCLDFKAKDIKN